MENYVSERQSALESIIEEQMELLRLSLFVATQGPVAFQGETLSCSLSEAKLRTSQPIAMAAGQSVRTILKCAGWRGIPVRDLYPVARSAVESFINSSFLLVEDEAVVERAVRWMKYRAWREGNRTVGSGLFTLHVSSPERIEAPVEFAEFTAKKACREWSLLTAPGRLDRVGQLAGKKAGSRLLGAYALVYHISSEIIHGSPFGVNYFYQAHLSTNPTTEDFKSSTGKQVEDILSGVAHAAAGYLSAFFRSMNMPAPYEEEQNLFNRLLVLEGVEPQEVERL